MFVTLTQNLTNLLVVQSFWSTLQDGKVLFWEVFIKAQNIYSTFNLRDVTMVGVCCRYY